MGSASPKMGSVGPKQNQRAVHRQYLPIRSGTVKALTGFSGQTGGPRM
ncbi:hypothetical protein DSCW_14320 [Desulfosarcina widdelii]|uniref:Uncharacterized protein n=1 Tax=Desulfosarcina widdelii TaxID=947919 RepID=A0A5K7Z010_9BACT|nr:hypothetical protein DSCW_14320 [Desulfosarcina widdelii]